MTPDSSNKLTDLERRALNLASHKTGVLVVRRRAAQPKEVTTAVANRLVARAWALVIDGRLRITAEGQRVLKAPLAPPQEIYLRQRWGTTTLLHLAVRGEQALMDVEELHPDWRERSEANRRLAQSDTQASRLSGLTHPEERLRELKRLAAERGVDVSDEMRFVDRGIRALERKVCSGTVEAA